MAMTEMLLETLVYSPFNRVTWLLSGEYFIEFVMKALNYISSDIICDMCANADL
jgi:hypothetical protein